MLLGILHFQSMFGACYPPILMLSGSWKFPAQRRPRLRNLRIALSAFRACPPSRDSSLGFTFKEIAGLYNPLPPLDWPRALLTVALPRAKPTPLPFTPLVLNIGAFL